MFRDKKLRTASILMTLSILLLVLLQAYWLRNAWFDEYRRLRRELSVILRETVIQEQMQQIVLLKMNNHGQEFTADTSLFQIRRYENSNDTGGKANIVIDVTGGDSGKFPMPPRLMTFEQEGHMDDIGDPRNLMVEFPSLLATNNLEKISNDYKKALSDAGISLSFTLRKVPGDSTRFISKREIRIRSQKGATQERLKRVNAEVVQARFDNPFLLLLQKIQWQLIFALVMIAVTATAFIFLYRNLRQQQRLSTLKNDFIANITHELKTPIATVSVAIEALKNFDAIHDTDKTKEYLDISGNELQRLNLLVDKVLKLSMLGQQKIELQQERIDLKLLLQEVLTSMKLQFEKQGAVVQLKTEGTDFTTVGDRMHLLSVFYNLLDNALKYSPVNPHIDIVLAKMGKRLEVKIADNGIGIADIHRRKIFDKFFRVPHGNTHNIKGYGLGLSYVQEVLQSHGGSIDVQSEEGKGSVFTVALNGEQ
jgi:two-component system phosphate regulon sensor histidine kinase PhoR